MTSLNQLLTTINRSYAVSQGAKRQLPKYTPVQIVSRSPLTVADTAKFIAYFETVFNIYTPYTYNQAALDYLNDALTVLGAPPRALSNLGSQNPELNYYWIANNLIPSTTSRTVINPNTGMIHGQFFIEKWPDLEEIVDDLKIIANDFISLDCDVAIMGHNGAVASFSISNGTLTPHTKPRAVIKRAAAKGRDSESIYQNSYGLPLVNYHLGRPERLRKDVASHLITLLRQNADKQ